MAVLFLDSSAVVKRYVQEIGSNWVRSLTDRISGNDCWLSNITPVEVLAGLYKNVRTGQITVAQAQQADLVVRGETRALFRLLPITRRSLAQAMNLVATHPLRTLDAIQLAAALQVAYQTQAFGGLPPMTLISADGVLNQAARAEGLAVDDPNLHP